MLVGVVLAAGEQKPEQARELARARDNRDPVSAAGTHALTSFPSTNAAPSSLTVVDGIAYFLGVMRQSV